MAMLRPLLLRGSVLTSKFAVFSTAFSFLEKSADDHREISGINKDYYYSS